MSQEQYLKKKMGFWSLTTLSLGGIIGSSWLFGPWVAAKLAGPQPYFLDYWCVCYHTHSACLC